MTDHLKRNLLLGLALAAVIAGVIIAVAPRGSPRHGGSKTKQGVARGSAPGDLQQAADYLHISRTELRRRLRTGETMAELANATPGRSANGLIATLLGSRATQLKGQGSSSTAEREALSRARSQIVSEANHARGRSGPVPAAAAYLGLSEPALRARLQAGESMNEIATAEHRSGAGLIEALTAVKASRLKTALAERAITAAEEKAALSTLHARVKREVEQPIAAGAR
jgi:hypothetical protein